MALLYYAHDDCLHHEMQPGHPERPDRLRAVNAMVEASGLAARMQRREVTEVEPVQLAAIHQAPYLSWLEAAQPAEGLVAVDPDTTMGPGSLRAARLAAGAVIAAVDAVLEAPGTRAFCAVRPPGHHAEGDAAMGFCFYNSIAAGARHAQAAHSAERVAVLDFDVHHGNGTVDIFKDDPSVLVCSSFQHPYYPHRYDDIERPNIVNTPLAAGTGSEAFRRAIEADWLPALAAHQPDLILVSAGFDAHVRDPLAQLELTDEDFHWVTALIADAAQRYCEGRIVSALEGGYDLAALASASQQHLEALLASPSGLGTTRGAGGGPASRELALDPALPAGQNGLLTSDFFTEMRLRVSYVTTRPDTGPLESQPVRSTRFPGAVRRCAAQARSGTR